MAQIEKNILKSRYKSVPIATPSQTLADFLLEAAKEQVRAGRSNWMTDSISGRTLTFAEIEPLSASIGSALTRRGFAPGDVALYLTSDISMVYVTMIGVWRCGGVLHASYTEDTAETLATRIREAEVRWIFCDGDEESVEKCKRVAKLAGIEGKRVEVFTYGDGPPVDGATPVRELLKDDGSRCPAAGGAGSTLDDPALILCTSGTTGLSKGAVYTHRAVLAFCLGTDAIPWSPQPALYLLKPTHVLGVLFPIRNINGGNWAVMMPQIAKENIYKAVEKYRPFLVFGFPTYLAALVTAPEAAAYDRSSVEIMCTGGIPITASIYETLLQLPSMKAVINGYGMTECGAVTTTVDLSHPEAIRAVPNLPPLTVGLLYPNTELKVLDLDTGAALPAGKHGELAFRSPVAASGYWRREEATKETFGEGTGGWIRSGDLGYYDDQGFLFVVDRIKETFKYFNNHISPVELEELLLQHPQVAEASVIGVVDPEGGDRIPRGFVVLKEGVKREEVRLEEIRRVVDGKVASYKQMRGGIHVVDSLPRGATGKVVRALVAKLPLP